MGVSIITSIPLIYRSTLGAERQRPFTFMSSNLDTGDSMWEIQTGVACTSHDNPLKTTGAQ